MYLEVIPHQFPIPFTLAGIILEIEGVTDVQNSGPNLLITYEGDQDKVKSAIEALPSVKEVRIP